MSNWNTGRGNWCDGARRTVRIREPQAIIQGSPVDLKLSTIVSVPPSCLQMRTDEVTAR